MKNLIIFFRNYGLTASLWIALGIGSLLGVIFGPHIKVIKPLGDIFLNLLFTVVVPLVFFSIAAAVAGMTDQKRLGRILGWMMMVFTITGIIASVVMVIGVLLYPPAAGMTMTLGAYEPSSAGNPADQLVAAFTVNDFANLLSKKNMLALIVFALIVGLAASSTGAQGAAFREFLKSGDAVMTRVISYLMLYAPVGLGAYVAYLVGVFGPELLGTYARAMVLYYPIAIAYFFIVFSFYAFWADTKNGIRRFWSNIMPAALTAFATGSSVATIPLNLEAARKNGTPQDIREVVIPIGATIHMEGSCLSAVLKIALLFGLFGRDFSGPEVLLGAVGIALLSGIVMSGIPGGGFLGEIMIVTMYGFPPEALPVISMIGALVDPPATMVNAVGDNVAGMMVARLMGDSKDSKG